MIKRVLLLILMFGVIVLGYQPTSLERLLTYSNCHYEAMNVSGSEVIEMSMADYDKLIKVLDLEIVSSKDISGRTIVEGYSSKLKDNVVIDNRKVNIQMSIFDNKIIIGYPLISGSF